MTITEIENLPLAELKVRRLELIAEAEVADASELAERYLQARADAKARDEKLAEQGVTIAALQEWVHIQKAALAQATADKDAAARVIAESELAVTALQGQLQFKDASLVAAHEVAVKIAKLATSRRAALAQVTDACRTALNDVASLVNPLLVAED